MRVTRWSLWVSGYGRAHGAGQVQGWPTAAGRPTHLRAPPPVFIYSMPGYKCSIRERMLYSSCKSRLLDSVEQGFQLEISKKVGASPRPQPCLLPSAWAVGSRDRQSRGRCCLWDGWGD